jgi:MoaA/NifB/PqqE/SkfB family radical SAM enzyme
VHDDIVRVWYVSGQRLCNFRCSYCVSIKEFAKSNSVDWLEKDDQTTFAKIVEWIGNRSFRLGIRLATLGEPFTSRTFLERAAWLSTRSNVEFIELLTNGSLLKKRLNQLEQDGDITKISIWATHHHSQISVPRFIENVRFAQEEYGCFVVVNGLLFPDNEESILELRAAAEAADLRFNLDLGYDPLTPHGAHRTLDAMVPILKHEDGIARAIALGADSELLRVNILALRDLRNQKCSAGHSYFYIGFHGDVFRCSRYQALGMDRLGNVLDDGFDLTLSDTQWAPCNAGFGCGNKEDFLNLQAHDRSVASRSPSLGWVGSSSHTKKR